jgi:hypothetical protein
VSATLSEWFQKTICTYIFRQRSGRKAPSQNSATKVLRYLGIRYGQRRKDIINEFIYGKVYVSVLMKILSFRSYCYVALELRKKYLKELREHSLFKAFIYLHIKTNKSIMFWCLLDGRTKLSRYFCNDKSQDIVHHLKRDAIPKRGITFRTYRLEIRWKWKNCT